MDIRFTELELLVKIERSGCVAAQLGFNTVINASGAILRPGIESTAFAYKLHRQPELASAGVAVGRAIFCVESDRYRDICVGCAHLSFRHQRGVTVLSEPSNRPGYDTASET